MLGCKGLIIQIMNCFNTLDYFPPHQFFFEIFGYEKNLISLTYYVINNFFILFYQFVKAVCTKMKEVVKPGVIAISLIKVNDRLIHKMACQTFFFK